MKKMLLGIFAAICVFVFSSVNAAECKNKVNIHIFWGNGCPHCEEAITWFGSIEKEYGKCFNLIKHEVWYDKDNSELMKSVAEYFGENVSGVPYIIIGDNTVSGFDPDSTDTYLDYIETASNNKDYVDVVDNIINKESGSKTAETIVSIAIVVVIVGGIAALVFVSRKNKND